MSTAADVAAQEGSVFSAQWLALREPVDAVSRAPALLAPLNDYLRQRGATPVGVLDLGAGSGANLRYLAPRLSPRAWWQLLDQDAGLLRAAQRSAVLTAGMHTRVFDLREPIDALLRDVQLVTASALLDLASAEWITRFCASCARSGVAVLVALSVDGRVTFAMPDPLDGLVMGAVRRDQARDKGLGPALGPDAAAFFVQSLQNEGYQVLARPSDWYLRSVHLPMVRMLLQGWQNAARAQCPQAGARVDAWAQRHLTAFEACDGALRVGHMDVLALPR